MRQHPAATKREWVCSAAAHEPISFNDSRLFEKHMRDFHAGTFAASELPDLARMSMRSTSHIFDHCPLCDENRESSLLSTVGQNVLLKHVASHLKDLALISIQWLQHDNDGKRDDSTSFTAKPSISNSSFTTRLGDLEDDDTGLTFEDPPEHQNISRRDYDTYTEDWLYPVEPLIPDPVWVNQTKLLGDTYISTFEDEWGFQKHLGMSLTDSGYLSSFPRTHTLRSLFPYHSAR